MVTRYTVVQDGQVYEPGDGCLQIKWLIVV